MNKSYKDSLAERLMDEEFRKEYESMSNDDDIIAAILNARQQTHLTQKELSERSGVAQSDISKLENGNSNPTVKMLQRLAQSMGMRLKIEFVSDTLD